MKILVFDDSPIHRESAKITLSGHDLTIVGTYEEAEKALKVSTDFELARTITDSLLEEAERNGASDKRDDLWKRAKKEATTFPDFDVVMTDLMVPPALRGLGRPKEFEGKEMPLGTIIALLALSVGITKVAIVTDTNHHSHPASAALDRFELGVSMNPHVSVVCENYNVEVMCDRETGKIVPCDYLRSEEGLKAYPPHESGFETEFDRPGLVYGLGKGKDWGRVLLNLLDA